MVEAKMKIHKGSAKITPSPIANFLYKEETGIFWPCKMTKIK